MALFLDPLPAGSAIQRVYAEVTSDVATTSTYPTYATLLTTSITTGANTLQMFFTTCFDSATTAPLLGYFRVLVDGTAVRGSACRTVATLQGCSLAILCRRAVTGGSHTVAVDWAAQSGGTCNIQAAGYPHIRHGALLIEEIRV
jgi:hypothetical protein